MSPRFISITRPSSMAAVARPEITIPTCSTTAREIPTFGSNGDPVEICWRLVLKAVAPFRECYLTPSSSCWVPISGASSLRL